MYSAFLANSNLCLLARRLPHPNDVLSAPAAHQQRRIMTFTMFHGTAMHTPQATDLTHHKDIEHRHSLT